MKFSELKQKIIQLAKEQEQGVEYRYNCFLCGDTRRRLYIKKEFNKVYAHCFNGGCRLNQKGIVINSSIDLNFVKNYLINKDNLNTQKSKNKFYNLNLIPTIPKHYVNYLLKYLPKNIIEKFNNNGVFQYDINRNRLAVKCVGGYVLRHIEQKPKWLNLGAKYFIAGKEYFKENKKIILTEDVISAVKLSEAQICTIALLGTNLSEKLKSSLRKALISSQGYVYIWLDKDIAGIKGALKIKKELEIFGKVSILNYPEAKLLSFKEIKNILKQEVFNE